MNITSLITVCKYIYNKINYNLVNTFYSSTIATNAYNTNILQTKLIHKPINANINNINNNNHINNTNNNIKPRNNQHTQYNQLLEYTNTHTKPQLIHCNNIKALTNKQYKKDVIPKRIKELVWTTYVGEVYFSKCYILWCNNIINVFNYHTGHDIPNSKGGTLDIQNLKPICSNCNLSMGNKYTIREWNKLIKLNNNK